jgi:hypothetical protein
LARSSLVEPKTVKLAIIPDQLTSSGRTTTAAVGNRPRLLFLFWTSPWLLFLSANSPSLAIDGHISSPGGLNGETYLKNWIEKGGEAKTFDLIREQDQLREATKHAISEVLSSGLRSW